MTSFSANERAERIIRSLKENSAAFVRKRRAQQFARIRNIILVCFVAALGFIAGIFAAKAF
jgi:transcriptional regulator of NAD metabolism